jgi:hypothetical protein
MDCVAKYHFTLAAMWVSWQAQAITHAQAPISRAQQQQQPVPEDDEKYLAGTVVRLGLVERESVFSSVTFFEIAD